MAIKVTFFKVAKRKNSTYVPPDASKYLTLQCNLKDDCSIVSPVLEVASGSATWSPLNVNYCHIADFGRYYWVSDWSYKNGLWIARCQSDPLASWRATIMDTNYYIIRTSTAVDPDIVDRLYPSYPIAETNVVRASKPLWAFEGDIGVGTYVVGIVGSSGVSTYYAMNSAGFSDLCTKMFSNIDWMKTGADFGDIEDDLIKTVLNPAQYVTSVMWFPANVAGDVSPVNIHVGWWEITGVNCTQITNRVLETINVSVTVPNHPQYSPTVRKYVNAFPYRRVKVSVGGFGVCEVDANKVIDGVDVAIVYDKRTGNARCNILSNGMLLANVYGTIGVPIAVSDIQQNLGGAILSSVLGIASTVAGDIVGAVSGLTGMVSDLATIDVSQVSSQGGVASLNGSVIVYVEAHEFVQTDNSRNGRPLCRVGKFSEYGEGYFKVMNGYTSCLGATPGEIDFITNTLEQGVFFA